MAQASNRSRQSAAKPSRSAKNGRSGGSTHDVQKVVSTLQLATSPTRMMILLLLADGEKFAGEIREALNNPSQPSVSHQLSLLRHGRLVESRRDGRRIIYRLSDVGRLVVQSFERLEA